MERGERFRRIDRLLRARGCVPIDVFLDELEVSKATFKRDLEYMRSRFYAPIVWDREGGGYRFGRPDPNAPRYELPGLWFNASEVHALLTMQHLLANLEPGILAPHLEGLTARLRDLLDSTDHSLEEIEGRIRILHMTSRACRWNISRR
jgi:predicted DNA-binding transcriptional regulator YafY